MATLWVMESLRLAIMPGGSAGSVLPLPPDRQQIVPIGDTSSQSAPFGLGTPVVAGQTHMMIRVHCDVACSISVGANPTATGADVRLAANQTEYFGVQIGQRIAVIANP